MYVNIHICISQGHALCVHSWSSSAFTTLTHPCTDHCADLCSFLGVDILEAHLGGYLCPELSCDILGTKHCALLSGCYWCSATFLYCRCSTNPIVLRSQPHRRAWNRFLLKKRNQNFLKKILGPFLQFDSLSNTDTHTHTYTYIHTHTHTHKTNKHVHAHQPFDKHNTLSSRYAEICVCIYLCVYIFLCVCVCVCVYACICLYVYVCLCLYLCVFMCVLCKPHKHTPTLTHNPRTHFKKIHRNAKKDHMPKQLHAREVRVECTLPCTAAHCTTLQHTTTHCSNCNTL